jgi:allantoinase
VVWSPKIIFGGDQYELQANHGTIIIDKESGVIDQCYPGESKDEAVRRTTTVKNLQQTKNSNPNNSEVEFIDISQINTTSSSLCLSPGLIDVHTHISSLGRNWEGYTTATQAAAAGGITTIIGMPLNSLPPTISVEIVEQELDVAIQSDLYVDVGLWGGVLPETASLTNQLSDLLSHPNVLGLKAFLSPLPENAGYQAISPNQLLEVAKICGRFDKPILVHSELLTPNDLEQSMKDSYPDDGSMDDSYAAHVKSRPPEWEQAAVRVVVEATKHCDMHVVHLSDAIGCLPIIQKRKQEILESTRNGKKMKRLTVETCPHYLLLDASIINDGDCLVKCFPPIREKEQRDRLWDGLSSGLIDMIASDHSPCEPSMRQQSMKNAWGGLTGLQYQLPATWTAAQESNHTFTEIEMARWWSCNPAKLARLTDKGSIEPGKQADFVVWDTDFCGEPDSYSREYHRWKGDCYYSSQKLRGRVMGTWLGSTKVYDGVNDNLQSHVGSCITDQSKY